MIEAPQHYNLRRGGRTLDFIYSRPISLVYVGIFYAHMLNFPGDVIAIVDGSGTTMAQYAYNAWGQPVLATGSLSGINPIRYRGYYYDAESGLYYLQSRYYDPVVKRFINADKFASTGQGFIGYNMFSYCENAPTSFIDFAGDRRIDAVSVQKETADQRRVSFAIQNKRLVDITHKLDTQMRRSANKLANYSVKNGAIAAAVYFYNSVKDGGQWDIKQNDEWKFQPGYTYLYRSSVLREDDTGNIHFGYVGAVLFSRNILCVGAGVNQWTKYGTKFGDITTFYDDPRDQEMIKWGYELFWCDLIGGAL